MYFFLILFVNWSNFVLYIRTPVIKMNKLRSKQFIYGKLYFNLNYTINSYQTMMST